MDDAYMFDDSSLKGIIVLLLVALLIFLALFVGMIFLTIGRGIQKMFWMKVRVPDAK